MRYMKFVHVFHNSSVLSINDVDASGEEKVREVAKRLRDVGVTLMFSGLKHQVMQVFERSGLVEELRPEVFFTDKETALQTLSERYGTLEVEHSQNA